MKSDAKETPRKINIGYVFEFILLLAFLSCTEERIVRKNYIAKFPDNKSGAVSFSFDDGSPSTFTDIVPALDQYGFKATFFIVPSLVSDPEWPKWKALVQRGYEVGNHSMHHFDLTTLPRGEILIEVNSAFDEIENRIGVSPRSFAPPGHKRNHLVDSIVFSKHFFSRTSPPKVCRWHGWSSSTKINDVKEYIRRAISNQEWYVVAAHGINDGWEPVTSKMVHSFLGYVDTHQDNLAIDTFERLAAYTTTREHATLDILESDNSKDLHIRSDLPEVKTFVPLTIVIDARDIPEYFQLSSTRSGEVKVRRKNDALIISSPVNTDIKIYW